MAFKVNSGKWKTVWYPKKASTAFSADSLVMFDSGTGNLTPATSSAGGTDLPIVGIYSGPAIASTDTTTNQIAILVPADPFATMIGDVTAGTLAATSQGAAFDLNSATGVNQGASTNNAVACAKFISATQGLFTINRGFNQVA